MEEKVLLVHLKNETGKKIQKLCKRLKIETIHVEEKDFMKSLKKIAGQDMKQKAGIEAGNGGIIHQESGELEETAENRIDFSEPMFVMINFTNELLDRYLKEYKVMHIEPVELKAVLTEYNQNWNVIKLYEELYGEREAFKKGNKEQ